MRLILMRHCKSSWATAGLADHDRPLNGRGKQSAEALGHWMRDQGYLPDLALVSSSVRTRQTFEGLALHCPLMADKRLYHASPEMVMGWVKEQDANMQSLLVIGHNPGLADLAWRLARTPVAHPRFGDYPTGATTVFEFDTEDWVEVGLGKAYARDFVIPRALLTS